MPKDVWLDSILPQKAIVILPVLLLFVLSIFAFEMTHYEEGMSALEESGYDGLIGPGADSKEVRVELDQTSGYARENTAYEFSYEVTEVPTSFNALLTWRDEPSEGRYENQPDFFRLTVVAPSGEEWTSDLVGNEIGQEARIALNVGPPANSKGAWTVKVEAGDCGDQTSLFRTAEDEGNQFSLAVSYEYKEFYYSETWFSWRGVVQTTMGLISIMAGLFLLNVSTKEKTIKTMLEGDYLPVFIAGLLFLFNGLALFSDGSSGFIWDKSYYLWANFISTSFYVATYPLLILFPLYYPRTIHSKLNPLKTRVSLLAAVSFFILLFITTHATHKEWYYSWRGYIDPLNSGVWAFYNMFYFVGIILCIFVFAYWYKSKKTSSMEKRVMAFMIAGFIFTPLNQWDLGNETISVMIVGRNIEALAATLLAIYLVVSGFLEMQKKGRLIKKDLLVIVAIFTAWMFLLFLNERVVYGLEGYALGFSLIRPICFTIAILQYKLFNINITRRILFYSSFSMVIGILFFSIQNWFQSNMPAYGLASILVITVLFFPFSALSNFFSEKMAYRVTTFLGLPRDKTEDGEYVEEEPGLPLGQYFKTLLQPRILVVVLVFCFFIEVLEDTLNDTIGYPAFMSIIYVGILFSALDYLVETSVMN